MSTFVQWPDMYLDNDALTVQLETQKQQKQEHQQGIEDRWVV